MLLLLLTAAEALAQDMSTTAATYAGPAGGLLGSGVAAAYIAERVLRKSGTDQEDLAEIKTKVQELHTWYVLDRQNESIAELIERRLDRTAEDKE